MSDEQGPASFAVVVNHAGMGHANPDLELKLLNTYLTMLLDNDPLPLAICFYASGVRMVINGSPVLEVLKRLNDRGVYLIICSTCLNDMELRDRVQVGVIGGMHDILEAQMRVDKVITL